MPFKQNIIEALAVDNSAHSTSPRDENKWHDLIKPARQFVMNHEVNPENRAPILTDPQKDIQLQTLFKKTEEELAKAR
jgi:hypothetical protein